MSEFKEIFKWAFVVGKEILQPKSGKYEEGKGRDLLKKLIFHIRAEETPGRFLERLSATLTEYRTNTNIQANVSLLPSIMEREWQADKFYYLKSAILTGLLNAMGRGEESGGKIE